jgi:hypothetical protein
VIKKTSFQGHICMDAGLKECIVDNDACVNIWAVGFRWCDITVGFF